jgi:hypothetical protein
MNKFWFLLSSLLMSIHVYSQSVRNEESYQEGFRLGMERAKLKIKVPSSFSDMKMKDCNYGQWACARIFYFRRVLINRDSTVVIGLEPDANFSWTNPSGEPMSTKTDWIKNANNVYWFNVDTVKEHKEMDKNFLIKYWGASYGMTYIQKRCNSPYVKASLKNNKVVLIANKDFQFKATYFYTDDLKPKIDEIINKTLIMVQRP